VRVVLLLHRLFCCGTGWLAGLLASVHAGFFVFIVPFTVSTIAMSASSVSVISPPARAATSFTQTLRTAWQRTNSLLCVGLDPELSRFPAPFAERLQRAEARSAGADEARAEVIFEFCRDVIDATAPFVCAFKPQIAYFAAHRAEAQLERLIAHIHATHPGIPVVLDAKRGDIGSTAQQYAREAFERYGADAVTVNPYMGFDSIQPYLEHAGKGVVVLCRTSNPGGSDLQFLKVDGKPLYQIVAEKAARQWNASGELSLVVGATFPNEIARVREIVGEMPLLIPGIGAQGGDVAATVAAGRTDSADSAGTGMMINSSRAVLYASSADDYAVKAAQAAQATRDAINACR
jgi:orotidine-5'-phosphate decarboxylase